MHALKNTNKTPGVNQQKRTESVDKHINKQKKEGIITQSYFICGYLFTDSEAKK